MSHADTRALACLGLLLVALASAPGDPKAADSPGSLDAEARVNRLEALARARLASAEKMYEHALTIYKQSSSGSSGVLYFWSNKVLDSQLRLAASDEDRAAAWQGHRDRMAKILALCRKVQKLGFSRKIDMEEATYYVLEADFNMALEKSP